MANTVGGKITWHLDVEAGKFKEGINQAKNEIKELESAFQKAEKSFKFVGKGLTDIGKIGLVGVGVMTAFAGAAAVFGANAELSAKTLEVVAKNAGMSAKELQGMRQSLEDVNTFGALADKTMITFIRSGLSAQVGFKDFIGLTKDFAASVGKTSGDAINDFTDALLTLNPGLLQTYGISLNLNHLYAEMGKELGKTATELTATEKRQALLNEITRQGAQIQGVYNEVYDTAGKNLLSIKGYVIVLTEALGQALAPAFGILTQAVLNALIGIKQFMTDNQGAIDAFSKKLEEFSQIAVDLFSRIFTWLLNNKDILVGALVAFAVGMTAVGVSFLIAHAPALIMFSLITLLVVVINRIAEALGGWNNIMKALQPILETVGNIFKDIIFPILESTWRIIEMAFIPVLKKLWEEISVVLIPILKILGFILLATVIGAIMAVVTTLWVIVSVLAYVFLVIESWVNNIVTFFTFLWTEGSRVIGNLIKDIFNFFDSIPGYVKNALSGLADIITKPFRDAWNFISPILDKIRAGLDKLNPFHRESPSLVDNVLAGVDIIKKAYGSISDITLAQPNLAYTSDNNMNRKEVFGQSGGVIVNVNEMNVNDQTDVERIGREIGFRVSVQ